MTWLFFQKNINILNKEIISIDINIFDNNLTAATLNKTDSISGVAIYEFK